MAEAPGVRTTILQARIGDRITLTSIDDSRTMTDRHPGMRGVVKDILMLAFAPRVELLVEVLWDDGDYSGILTPPDTYIVDTPVANR